MHRSSRTLLVGFVTLIAVSLFAAACSSPQPGVKNRMGTYEKELDASPRRVTEAAEAALRDMDLTINNSWATEVDGRVDAETPENSVTVKVSKATAETSRIAIHVGLFGDEAISLALLKRIERRLDSGMDGGGEGDGAATQPME